MKEVLKSFWQNRFQYAKILAAVGSVFGVLFALDMFGTFELPDLVLVICGLLWMICTVGAYLLCGLLNAIKMALSIAKWGWLLVPVFPVDLLIALVAGVFALIALLFVPIVPVMKAAGEAGE